MILANKFHQHFHRKTQKAALQRMNNRISLLRIQPVDSSIHPSHISPPLVKMLYVLVLLVFMLNSVCLEAASDSSSYSIRLPGHPYESSWEETVDDDAGVGRAWVSSGREFSLFDSRGVTSRGGAGSGGPFDSNYIYNRGTQRRTQEDDDDDDDDDDDTSDKNRRPFRSRYGSSGGRYNYKNGPRSLPSRDKKRTPEIFQTLSDWWATTITPTIKDWPKIQCRVEPTTTLKIRKTFRPLKTIVRFGADFNTQLGVWQFKSSWEDAIIGGKLTLAGRELQLTKSWQLSVGAVEDLVTRLRFRAAIDLQTWKAYARVGFRTERLSPINVMEGFTLMKRLPLDGNKGHVKLEVKANFALPEPEIELSTETQRSLVGMGNLEVSIDELNLLLDY